MALKKTHWEILDFSASYSLSHCRQYEKGSDSRVNKVFKTIGIEYTKIITILQRQADTAPILGSA